LWQTAALEGEAGHALAAYASSLGGRAYVLKGGDETSQAESDAFAKALVNVGVARGQVMQTDTGTEFGATVQEAVKALANTIFAAHLGETAAKLLSEYQSESASLSPKIPLIGPGSLTESIDLTKLGTPPGDVYTASYYAPDLDNDANRQFLAALQNTSSVPSSVTMASYDAAAVLDRALMQIQSGLTSDRLNKAIKGLGQIQSPRGNWTFNAAQSPQQNWYLRKLRLDGQVPANLLDRDLGVFGSNS
jgi:branched-chain amino acid transport system substrate-binding protein